MKLKWKIPCVFLIIFAFCTMLFTLSCIFPQIAGFMNRTLCNAVRISLASITSVFPFSVFEIFVIAAPVLLIYVVLFIFRATSDNIRKRFISILSVFSFILSLYILTLGISYKAPSVIRMYGDNITKEQIISSAEKLTDYVNEISGNINNLPHLSELRDELSDSYAEILFDYGYDMQTFPRPKRVILSRLLSYAGCLALYSFPTGEVNINAEIPEYTVPFTVAHEYAHVMGISSERDANFFGFLSCAHSENLYIKYSGLLSGLEYLLLDIYTADSSSYNNIYEGLSERARSDMSLYRQYSKKYSQSFIYRASDKINSAHLDVWDGCGKDSYSEVSKCIVNYLNHPQSLRIKCSETTVFWSEKWDDLLYTEAKL